MSKAVLISIRTVWVEKIVRNEKTVEVRKTRPKLDTPFKCYIYCTQGNDARRLRGSWGKVIGEFTCDRITPLFNVCTDNWHHLAGDVHEWHKELVKRACLTDAELKAYAKGQNCFAWHISDLKIYDKPRELREFKKNNRDCFYADLGIAKRDCPDCKNSGCFLERPPQSWRYMEELR